MTVYVGLSPVIAHKVGATVDTSFLLFWKLSLLMFINYSQYADVNVYVYMRTGSYEKWYRMQWAVGLRHKKFIFNFT